MSNEVCSIFNRTDLILPSNRSDTIQRVSSNKRLELIEFLLEIHENRDYNIHECEIRLPGLFVCKSEVTLTSFEVCSFLDLSLTRIRIIDIEAGFALDACLLHVAWALYLFD